ncbi:Molybdenum ABC transporter ATP-binding protein ModC [hydrothermal vent metagenome]|uniref:Molybdenum ABC transporter ATP-binding protein ModC n=1 Tax=hydrothermal vent metagenome TaxID=652676 RepID=A0A3B1CSI1_9ZZZZ
MNELTANFEVRFPGFHLDARLKIPKSGVTVLFGPSGSGKTTLLRCLAGLERSPSGCMQFGDTVWQDENRGIFKPVNERPIGLVFQEPRLFPHMNVRSNLLYGFKRIPENIRRIVLDDVVEVLNIAHLLDRQPGFLSGGEGQRVAIGRALLTSPKLLLMDEPLASLDHQRKQEILPYIRRLQSRWNIPIIYISHSLDEILQLVDTVILLKEGRIVAHGSAKKVFSRLDLRGLINSEILGAIFDTKVVAHEPEFGLTRVRFMDHQLLVPRLAASPGQSVRLHIHSNDVSIVTSPPNIRTSVLNILEATVIEIGPIDATGYSVDISLDVGQTLLATITRKSLLNLGLEPGQKVYAHIKAIKMVHE